MSREDKVIGVFSNNQVVDLRTCDLPHKYFKVVAMDDEDMSKHRQNVKEKIKIKLHDLAYTPHDKPQAIRLKIKNEIILLLSELVI